MTNGITYKVYHSTEKAEAPDKLLFEISLDPKETEGMPIQQVANQFARFSREAMAKGVLDQIGEQVFTTGKIRKAIDKLFMDPPNSLIKLIRSIVKDDSIKPIQVKESLKRLWLQTSENEISSDYKCKYETPDKTAKKEKEYDEEYHLEGKPQEIVELFKTIDNFCRNLDPVNVKRKYLAKYVKYMCGKGIFCCVHIHKIGLRVWIKLNYSELENPPEYARDVSKIGHWGVGDVELTIDGIEKFQNAKYLIQKSFEKIR